MRVSLFIPLLLLTGGGCGESALSPSGSLTGQWDWQFNRNPSGSMVTLSLATAGSAVTGTGTICGVGPSCMPGSVAVSGRSVGVVFELTMRGGSGFVATYSGHLASSNELTGTWVDGATSSTVIFYRQ
jgi:hypothetical protein